MPNTKYLKSISIFLYLLPSFIKKIASLLFIFKRLIYLMCWLCWILAVEGLSLVEVGGLFTAADSLVAELGL